MPCWCTRVLLQDGYPRVEGIQGHFLFRGKLRASSFLHLENNSSSDSRKVYRCLLFEQTLRLPWAGFSKWLKTTGIKSAFHGWPQFRFIWQNEFLLAIESGQLNCLDESDLAFRMPPDSREIYYYCCKLSGRMKSRYSYVEGWLRKYKFLFRRWEEA